VLVAKGRERRAKRLDVDERKAQLLEIALRAFARRSYDDVSIEDVAKKANISRSLVFHYFPTKRDLYIAAIREAARRLLADTETPEQGTPQERLRAGLDRYLAYVETHAESYAALLRGGIGSDTRVERIVEETRQAFIERLFAGLPMTARLPVVRAAMRGWLGFVEAVALDWIDHRDVPKESLRDVMSAVLFEALRAAAGPLLTSSQ
jgi:AcrR family transcriptional regulator